MENILEVNQVKNTTKLKLDYTKLSTLKLLMTYRFQQKGQTLD